jgi:hypothetical protein
MGRTDEDAYMAGAMTGVKEQVAGNYGERIAKAGYMT